MENAHIKTHTVLDTLLSAVSAAVCAAMLCAAAAYVLLDAPRHGAAICLAGVAAALLLALPARGTRRFSAAKLGAAVALTALAVRAAYTLSVETVPVSDFELLYSAAQEVAGGNPGALSGEYFELWGYQKPFVYYEALVIALGGGTTALGLLNAAWGALTAWLVFAIARRFTSDGAAFAAALLYALSPGAIMLTPVATNQCVSLALILLGVYLAVSGSGWRRAALAGCALAAGNLMRPEGIIAVGGLAAAAVDVQQRPGRRDADHGVEALVHDLGHGGGHHGAAALGVAPHHAEKGEEERRGRQHAQGPPQALRLVKSLQYMGAEIEQTKGKRAHGQGEQQRHRQHPGGVAVLPPGQPGRHHLGYRRGQAHGREGQRHRVDAEGHGVDAVALVAQQVRHGDAV